MAFSEQDRVAIRTYLGYPQIWLQADPRLEQAVSNIQAIADGGTRPNQPNGQGPSFAEMAARTLIQQLQQVDQSLLNLSSLMGGNAVGKIQVDAAREDNRLRALGRMFVARLAHMFDTVPVNDVYTALDPSEGFAGRGVALGPFGGRTGY